MRAPCLVQLLLVLLALSSSTRGQTPPWTGQLFNYQLSETFVYPDHVIQNVRVYGVDHEATTAATVSAMVNASLVPICYFSTQYENWRTDASSFPVSVIGNALDGWPGENYVDIRSPIVRTIMKNRIAACKAKGFRAVDPDNTDGYLTSTGFPLTAADALDFLTFLSTEARAQGLGIGLKNTLELIASNVGLWDFAVNEQCFQYSECSYYAPFKAAGKPVFQIEYTSSSNFQANVCPQTAAAGTTSINKLLALKAQPWEACGTPPAPSPAPKASPSPSPKPPSPSPKPPSPSPKPPSPSPKPPSPSPKPPSPSPKPPSPSPKPPSPSPAPPSPSPSPPPQQQPQAACGQALAIPTYFYPAGAGAALWQQAKVAGARVVIINPASGAGPGVDPNYATTAADMRAAGITVLGYATTSYAQRDPALVRADIDKYYQWYNVSGVFLDEASNSCADLPYYQALIGYVRARYPAATTALNQGTDGPECFLSSPNATDILLGFENSYAAYLAWAGPPAWTAKYNASRFWHLVHSAPATPEAFYHALTLSKDRRAGYVYVTDDVYAVPTDDPWDSLPSAPMGLLRLEASLVYSSQQIALQGPYTTPCTSACAWTRARGTSRLALVNPNSGPGSAADPAWQQLINTMRPNGTLMLGYVDTAGATKPAAAAQNETWTYYHQYKNLSGIFFDGLSENCSTVAYYQSLVSYLRTSLHSNAVVVFNWGSDGSECFLTAANTADIFGVYESTASSYLSWTPPAWHAKYPPYRFWHVVLSASATTGSTTSFAPVLAASRAKRAGFVFVTNAANLNNVPLDSQWGPEVATVANATLC